MTLTEEQREAIRVISKLPMAIGCQLCHPYIMKNYGSHFIVLRDMIDSSGTVGPTGDFDLERARGLRDFLQDDCAEVGDVWGEMIAEIERLRAENAWLKSDREFQSEEQSARIKELEDAHKRSGAKYAKIINELRSSVYANIPGLKEGKIGPDAKPHCWQITDERVEALWHAIKVLKENDIMEEPEEHLWDEEVTVLQAMLTEADHDKP